MLERRDYPVRVVVPAEREKVILSIQLQDVLAGWDEAQRDGCVEIVTAREEARRIASGDQKKTILLGYRTGVHRYLDLYPSYCTEVIAYPYEMDIEISQQEFQYDFLESFQNELVRVPLLSKLQFPVRRTGQCLKSPRPTFKKAGRIQSRANKVRPVHIEPRTMDLERLATRGMLDLGDLDFQDTQLAERRLIADSSKRCPSLTMTGDAFPMPPGRG